MFTSLIFFRCTIPFYGPTLQFCYTAQGYDVPIKASIILLCYHYSRKSGFYKNKNTWYIWYTCRQVSCHRSLYPSVAWLVNSPQEVCMSCWDLWILHNLRTAPHSGFSADPALDLSPSLWCSNPEIIPTQCHITHVKPQYIKILVLHML